LRNLRLRHAIFQIAPPTFEAWQSAQEESDDGSKDDACEQNSVKMRHLVFWRPYVLSAPRVSKPKPLSEWLGSNERTIVALGSCGVGIGDNERIRRGVGDEQGGPVRRAQIGGSLNRVVLSRQTGENKAELVR
jgi:hypothetical protein